MSGHTAGPWVVIPTPRGFIISALNGAYDIAVVRDIGSENNEANAALIADAPAMKLALDLIAAGVAEIRTDGYPSFRLWTGEGWNDFSEAKIFDWTTAVKEIGWQRCVEALAAASNGEMK